MITINIQDAITPYIRGWLSANPSFIRGLTKSLGWYAQKEIKRLAVSSELSSSWEERTPLKVRRALNEKAPIPWWGRLRRAIGNQYQDGDGGASVRLGWVSQTAATYGRVQEKGVERVVTPFLRKFFGSHGVPLKASTKVLKVPARPLFEPAMLRVDLRSHLEAQVAKYIEKGYIKGIGKGRKYQVFN